MNAVALSIVCANAGFAIGVTWTTIRWVRIHRQLQKAVEYNAATARLQQVAATMEERNAAIRMLNRHIAQVENLDAVQPMMLYRNALAHAAHRDEVDDPGQISEQLAEELAATKAAVNGE